MVFLMDSIKGVTKKYDRLDTLYQYNQHLHIDGHTEDTIARISLDKISGSAKYDSILDVKISDHIEPLTNPGDRPFPDVSVNGIPSKAAGINTSLPGSALKIPEVPSVDISEGEMAYGKIKNSDIPHVNKDDLKDKVALPPMKDALPDEHPISQKMDQASDVVETKDKLKKIDREDLKTEAQDGLEENVKRLEEVTEVSNASGQVDAAKEKLTQQPEEYNAIIERYKDKKKLQEEIIKKSRNVANDKFNKLAPAVKDAEAKISKSRKLKSTILSLKNSDLKRENAMKGKPLSERIVPGITMQTYPQNLILMDVGMQIGYKLSGRFLVGGAWVNYFSVDERNPALFESESIYGYRMFTDVGLLGKFYGHVEFESLSFDVKQDIHNPKEELDRYARNWNFGVGSRYEISHRFKGSILALYKVTVNGIEPSHTRINIRIGVDLNLKKKKKIVGLAASR
jgi:hypothetical protein